MGNGFTSVPYHLAKEEIWANCEECNSQGYISGNKWDTDGRRPYLIIKNDAEASYL